MEIVFIYDNVRLGMLAGSILFLGATVVYGYAQHRKLRDKTHDYQSRFDSDKRGNTRVIKPGKAYKF